MIDERFAKYEHFIVDLWGVIHDGTNTYEGVLEAIDALNKAGKKIIFLSNAPRRAKKVAEVLNYMGITSDKYLGIITSGEACYLALEGNREPIFYIGPKRDLDVLNGLDCEVKMEYAKGCKYAVLTGFVNDDNDIESNFPALKSALDAGLVLYCLNPDKVAVKQNGFRWLCAGVLAEEYEKMGGKVVYFGKPYAPVYELVMQKFNNPHKKLVLAIGDSISTDIAGANNFGIESVFITNGIHKSEIGTMGLEKYLSQTPHKPNYSLDFFGDLIT
jgi:HAD superfamily hydrolase (TIGR01459 family)